jgi:Chaperone of endosialidase
MSSSIQPKSTVTTVLCCFVLCSTLRAVSPPPDGGYSGANTAEGTDALFHLSTGVWNSAFGFRALYKNATGIRNTAVGYQALYNTNGSFGTHGRDNVAVGADALFSNTTGNSNIAIGFYALYDNSTGSNNIAIGNGALQHNFNGSGNTVVGDSFSSTLDSVSVGRAPAIHCPQGFYYPGVHYASINAQTNVDVGQYLPEDPFCGIPDLTTDTIHINAKTAVYVRAVYGNPITGSPVNIDSNGQLGVAASSKRFKTDIKSMDLASEAILALRPVTFRYKEGIDPNRAAQFGLVAEEVEKVNPDLVSRDAKGNPYTVRYDAVNAMLLNEFLKEHRKVRELETNIAQLKSSAAKQNAIALQQQKEIGALTAGLQEQARRFQKLSAQIEASKPASQVVVTDHN